MNDNNSINSINNSNSSHNRGGSKQGNVRLEGVVKRHGETTVLHGVDLEIRAGEFFVLLGPSGSGKTTTLRILAGLEPVSEGTVYIDGEDVTSAEPGERDVAMVFQSYALYPHMTVAENIGFPLKMVGTDKAAIARAVEDAAGRVSIGHLLARRPGQLSGGPQQRGALARAIVRQPRGLPLGRPPAPPRPPPAPGSPGAPSSSAWRWPGPSCGSPGCSCWTSRCPTSTPSCAWKRDWN